MKTKKTPLSVYIHIPFCVRKCLYCDFLSAPAQRQQQIDYVDALCREVVIESKSYVNYETQTVFFGGGTPSVLEGEDICRILETLHKYYNFSQDCEITIEVNPGTVTKEKLSAYHKAGINRLSIGLQSTVDSELKALGRIHDYAAFLETHEIAVKSGFNNINIDLMSAIPGQTLQSYKETLEKIVNLKPAPPHISAYSLIIEEGTPFAEKTPELPDEDSEREMYKITNAFLSKHGYHRYEISNYAKEGYECRHNQVYWRRGDYVGFGIGAASLVQNVRFSNEIYIERYVNQISQGNETKVDRQELSVHEQMEEFMFLGLRMMSGVSANEFEDLYGQRIDCVYPGIVEKFCKKGLLERKRITLNGDERIFLTELGIDVSNQVMAEFLLS